MQIIGFGIKRVTDYFVGIYSNLNSCRHLQTKPAGYGNLTNFNGQLHLLWCLFTRSKKIGEIGTYEKE